MADYTPYITTPLRTLFRRCLECPDITPSCPTCASGEVCTQISASCMQCASRVCIKRSKAGTVNNQSPSKGPNVGAIAGGVIAGVLVIALATYLIWRFFIKNKQQSYEDDIFADGDDELDFPTTNNEGGGVGGVEKQQQARTVGFAAHRSARASTHTVESFASSVFTRASNVIQIAFIPGITDRSGNAIPPVPPVPIPTNNASPSVALSSGKDHYFMPSDLRDSTFTAYTDDSRSSIARQSLTPSLARGSVASTIFRQGTLVNAEAVQTAHRGRAAVVSVKNATPADTPTTASTPALQKADYYKYNNNNARAADGDNEIPLINLGPDSNNATAGPAFPSRTLPGLLQPTIFNAGGGGVKKAERNLLAQQITEATRRASRAPVHGGLGSLSLSSSGAGAGVKGKERDVGVDVGAVGDIREEEEEEENEDEDEQGPFGDRHAI